MDPTQQQSAQQAQMAAWARKGRPQVDPQQQQMQQQLAMKRALGGQQPVGQRQPPAWGQQKPPGQPAAPAQQNAAPQAGFRKPPVMSAVAPAHGQGTSVGSSVTGQAPAAAPAPPAPQGETQQPAATPPAGPGGYPTFAGSQTAPVSVATGDNQQRSFSGQMVDAFSYYGVPQSQWNAISQQALQAGQSPFAYLAANYQPAAQQQQTQPTTQPQQADALGAYHPQAMAMAAESTTAGLGQYAGGTASGTANLKQGTSVLANGNTMQVDAQGGVSIYSPTGQGIIGVPAGSVTPEYLASHPDTAKQLADAGFTLPTAGYTMGGQQLQLQTASDGQPYFTDSTGKQIPGWTAPDGTIYPMPDNIQAGGAAYGYSIGLTPEQYGQAIGNYAAYGNAWAQSHPGEAMPFQSLQQWLEGGSPVAPGQVQPPATQYPPSLTMDGQQLTLRSDGLYYQTADGKLYDAAAVNNYLNPQPAQQTSDLHPAGSPGPTPGTIYDGNGNVIPDWGGHDAPLFGGVLQPATLSGAGTVDTGLPIQPTRPDTWSLPGLTPEQNAQYDSLAKQIEQIWPKGALAPTDPTAYNQIAAQMWQLEQTATAAGGGLVSPNTDIFGGVMAPAAPPPGYTYDASGKLIATGGGSTSQTVQQQTSTIPTSSTGTLQAGTYTLASGNTALVDANGGLSIYGPGQTATPGSPGIAGFNAEAITPEVLAQYGISTGTSSGYVPDYFKDGMKLTTNNGTTATWQSGQWWVQGPSGLVPVDASRYAELGLPSPTGATGGTGGATSGGGGIVAGDQFGGGTGGTGSTGTGGTGTGGGTILTSGGGTGGTGGTGASSGYGGTVPKVGSDAFNQAAYDQLYQTIQNDIKAGVVPDTYLQAMNNQWQDPLAQQLRQIPNSVWSAIQQGFNQNLNPQTTIQERVAPDVSSSAPTPVDPFWQDLLGGYSPESAQSLYANAKEYGDAGSQNLQSALTSSLTSGVNQQGMYDKFYNPQKAQLDFERDRAMQQLNENLAARGMSNSTEGSRERADLEERFARLQQQAQSGALAQSTQYQQQYAQQAGQELAGQRGFSLATTQGQATSLQDAASRRLQALMQQQAAIQARGGQTLTLDQMRQQAWADTVGQQLQRQLALQNVSTRGAELTQQQRQYNQGLQQQYAQLGSSLGLGVMGQQTQRGAEEYGSFVDRFNVQEARRQALQAALAMAATSGGATQAGGGTNINVGTGGTATAPKTPTYTVQSIPPPGYTIQSNDGTVQNAYGQKAYWTGQYWMNLATQQPF